MAMIPFRSTVSALLVTVALVSPPLAAAQATSITPPKNKYSVQDDVKAGEEAAAQVERQMPILTDDAVSSYVEDIGERLVGVIPQELRHPEFHYRFKVVDVKEINAFALPGGPMFVNRGMLDAAKTEGQIAGVMAHELAHVALRHGTAQATVATKYEIGQVAGTILGAIIGGTAGAVVAKGSQLGIGVSFLRFSREYEKQADLLGVHMMAAAGYDPIDMANVFRTIEQQGGAGGPEFLSDHPNPGNRIEYITAEARSLRVDRPVRDTKGFERIKTHLASLPPAREGSRTAANGASAPPSGDIEPPDGRYRTYAEGNLFRVDVPDNWRELPAGNNAVWFAPAGAYGTAGGQAVFTHGVQFGVGQVQTRDLEDATRALLQSLKQGNPRLRQDDPATRTPFADREGLAVTLRNVSDATGQPEIVSIRTALVTDGVLLYSIAVAPERDFARYAPVFRKVTDSVQTTGRQ